MSFSVLISVYTKENPKFLNQAFLSIWDQQSLRPDQIVLVKDGPLTSDLERVISYWQGYLGTALDVVALSENSGLGAALNEGLGTCEYELVLRMDTDDIAEPDRFKWQVDFMEARPHIAASSGQIEEWDDDLLVMVGKRTLPLEPDAVASFAKTRSPLNHAAAIFRKSVVQGVGGYPPLRKAQDYGLWAMLLLHGHQLANLPDVLLKVRTGHEEFVRRGAAFLGHELILLNFQRQIGFLRSDQFLFNILMKVGLRILPVFLKKIAYRFLR